MREIFDELVDASVNQWRRRNRRLAGSVMEGFGQYQDGQNSEQFVIGKFQNLSGNYYARQSNRASHSPADVYALGNRRDRNGAYFWHIMLVQAKSSRYRNQIDHLDEDDKRTLINLAELVLELLSSRQFFGGNLPATIVTTGYAGVWNDPTPIIPHRLVETEYFNLRRKSTGNIDFQSARSRVIDAYRQLKG